MAREFYVPICRYEHSDLGRTVEPDLPDSLLNVGTRIRYLDDGTALVEFKRDLTEREVSLADARDAVSAKDDRPPSFDARLYARVKEDDALDAREP